MIVNKLTAPDIDIAIYLENKNKHHQKIHKK